MIATGLERDEHLPDLLWNSKQKCKYESLAWRGSTAMSDTNISVILTQYERPEHIFPTLSAAQIAGVAAHGRTRTVQAGEVLVEPGDNNLPLFLVISGAMEILRPP